MLPEIIYYQRWHIDFILIAVAMVGGGREHGSFALLAAVCVPAILVYQNTFLKHHVTTI